MHIARAYCVEADKIVDIYRAHAFFFQQAEPRRRLQFFCSDDVCRSANGTKVSGVNYDKLVEEGDRIVQKPDFRMKGESAQRRLRMGCTTESAGTTRSGWRECADEIARRQLPTLKASDLVSFWPDLRAAPALASGKTNSAMSPSVDRKSAVPRNTGTYQQLRSSNRTRVDFLEIVTSAYELLEPEERCEATLRIGLGPTFSYHNAFCRIEHYLGVVGPRIFHGGVRVQLHGPDFAIRFFDRVQPFQGGSKIPLAVSLYLKHEVLKAYWNGRFLAAQLEETPKPAHYAQCYFFGRLVPHPTRSDHLIAAGTQH